jgi:hypothetical protein
MANAMPMTPRHPTKVKLMKTIRRTHLPLLSATLLSTLGLAQHVHAVHLNGHGTGQVLIYPYYTVRNANGGAYNSLITVVNTTFETKAVKVRFLESRNGAQVMDFNLYLSPNDVWTSAALSSANGTRLLTGDNSCVVPGDLFTATGKNEFRNQAYLNDSGPVDLDRTREGHIEVIEMGVVTNTQITGYIKQNTASVPANCGALTGIDTTNAGVAAFPAGLAPPTGGLSGRGVIIIPSNGASYGYDAVALDAWSATVQYTPAGSTGPLLSAANPPISEVLTPKGVVRATWENGRNAVSAVLMRNEINNEFSLDKGTGSQTDWVVTFPTKREHVRPGTGVALSPFNQNFNMPSATDGGSCDPYRVGVFDREAGSPSAPVTVIFSGAPVLDAAGSITCWNTNVIPFVARKSLLGSTSINDLVPGVYSFALNAITTAGPATSTTGTQGPNGSLKMAFNGLTQGLSPITATLNGVKLVSGRHTGLPLIALSFTNFLNNGVKSQYGIVHQAKYTTNIAP